LGHAHPHRPRDSGHLLAEQLRPELFEDACRDAGVDLILRRQVGYDHSYYFIRTFMGDHIHHHARLLNTL
jgi:S-formylglutathione hydrolase